MQVRANGIRIEVEDTGAPGDGKPVVLLIMGLGMQLVAWPPALVRAFTQSGYRVIRFDNRDIGLSQWFDELGRPNMAWLLLKKKLGLKLNPGYTLADMANDAIGVLDALRVDRAHVIGVSMGGMIAQRVAITAPDRVHSLVSIMSSSGEPNLPGAQPELLRALLGRPRGKDLAAIEAYFLRVLPMLSGSIHKADVELLRAGVRFGLQRAEHQVGTLRQMVAIGADVDRYRQLGHIATPTLVLHGRDDPLVPLACGQDTADRIHGARMEVIDGWGHDFAPTALPLVIQALLNHVQVHTPTLA
jgi:pimeloyl-ACP methyl ester carboxylesterase